MRHSFVSPKHWQAESPLAIPFFESRPQSRLRHQPADSAAGLPDVDASPAPQSCGQDIPETTLDNAGFVVISELARGHHSSVHLVQKAATEIELGGLRCVKRFPKSVSCEERASVEREFHVMRKVCDHPRILDAFSLFQDGSSYYIEMPYCEGGVLIDLKRHAIAAGVSLTEVWWSNVFKSCVEALVHLHTHEVIHCDVKEANLMAKTSDYFEPEIVLVDFGIAQDRSHVCIDDKDCKKPDIIYGTPGYIPPEVWSSKVWTPAGDMFSLGVVISQLLMERSGLFTEGTSCLKDIKHATQTREPPFDSIDQMHLRKLARDLLEKVPSARSRAVDALSAIYTINFKLSDDASPEQANVLPEKTRIPEDAIADASKEDGSSSISTASGLDSPPPSPSLASSCSDCEGQ